MSWDCEKINFDQHHKARPLKQLESGQRAWILDMETEGTVKQLIACRSYLITMAQGTIQRNRHHLRYY